ncbi:RNA-binding protein Raly [Nephila pilipes]|uniref:RNA-binding protein Raly n=1 Tax=Nephila pilipes TaxID=299642 RepID=A0A8X6MG65_NEPPI|nr:RNA-binding protein Raly [Nephila pilipes]
MLRLLLCVEAATAPPASAAVAMTRVGNHTNSSDPQSVQSRVFVGNLNTYVVGKEEVERIFSRYGRLIGISMHKGYAFVQYTDTWDARNAVVGEDGRTVAGQLLDVNMVSEPKPHQVNRKRSLFSPATFVNVNRVSLPKAGALGSGTQTFSPRFTDKSSIHPTLYNNGEPDILICGNCKEVFPGIHKLIEHKKQSCKLRFTCRCQHTSSPPGAPAMPVCAQCQSRQNTWWDLVQHFQVAHNALLYVKDEELTDTSHKGEEEGSTCSNCSTSDSRNGTSLTQDCCWEEQRDAATEADIRDEEEENRHHPTPPAEDKSVDTTDLKASLG